MFTRSIYKAVMVRHFVLFIDLLSMLTNLQGSVKIKYHHVLVYLCISLIHRNIIKNSQNLIDIITKPQKLGSRIQSFIWLYELVANLYLGKGSNFQFACDMLDTKILSWFGLNYIYEYRYMKSDICCTIMDIASVKILISV